VSGAASVASVRAGIRAASRQIGGLGVFPISEAEVAGPPVGQRRRLRWRGETDPIGVATLVLNEEGVLLWHEGTVARSLAGRRGRRGVPAAPEGEVVDLYEFQRLECNEIGNALRHLDDSLNRNQGLREFRDGTWHPADAVTGKKRRLLIVHGTFSECGAITDAILAGPDGPAFLKRAAKRYDQILGFDHPTLSVGPTLNAFDLARLLARSRGPLDVIAHSRGGLVARWLLEGFGVEAGPCRAVLVGSPLGGTSLASPPQLRRSLSVLSNIGAALQAVGFAPSIANPFVAVPLALLRIAASVITVAAKAPILDAAVAIVPGLSAQSRTGDNQEIARIKSVRLAAPPEYFVVRSNFEPTAAEWRFWQWFRKDRIADAAADHVFAGPNDLVVDTESMTEFSKGTFSAERVLDFGTNPTVHHVNYFQQTRTVEFMEERLALGG
jgi:hypothetical protein